MPLHGALLQEAIDAGVIANALRVLRVRPMRAARFNLAPEELQRLREERESLAQVLDRLAAVADRPPSLRGAKLTEALTGLDKMLREQLLPHEDDRELYPAVADLLGGDDPMAATSRTHREIFRLHRRLSMGIARLPRPDPDSDPRAVQDLQRILHTLDAIVRLHFAKEEEIYESLARD